MKKPFFPSMVLTFALAFSLNVVAPFVGSQAVAGALPVQPTKTRIVDSRLGPYKTLGAAKTAAVSGDTIYVRGGTYNEKNLAKNGVNWHFENNAVVNYTGTVNGGIWDDSSTGANTAVACKVTGHGQFKRTGTANAADGDYWVVKETNASSDVVIECDTILESLPVSQNADGPGSSGAIRHTAGSMKVSGRLLTTIYNSGWWWNEGEAYVNFDTISGTGDSGNPIYVTATRVANNAWIHARLIQSTTNDAVQVYGYGVGLSDARTAIARVWITADEIRSQSSTVHFGGTYIYLYLDTKKLGIVNSAADLFTNPSRVFQFSSDVDAGGSVNAVAWVRAQKLTAGVRGLLLDAGTTHFDIMHAEDPENVAGAIVETNGGTHDIRIRESIGGSGAHGLQHDGGEVVYSGRISTLAASAKFPVIVASSGLTLMDVALTSHASAADVISAATAQTITKIGTISDVSGKGKHANVTITAIAGL